MTKKIVFRKFVKKQKGFTIIELSVVILLVAALYFFVNEGAGLVTNYISNNRETSDISSYVSKTRAKYTNVPDFSGATIAGLRGSDVFPDSAVSGTTVHNQFGGAISLTVGNSTNGTNDLLTFSSGNYPKKSCGSIPSFLSSTAYSISINGTQVKAAGGALNVDTFAVNCTAGNTNTIAFSITKNP